MAVPLEKFVKQLEDSGILAGDTLQDFLPPKSEPKSAEELAMELVRQKKLTKFQVEEVSRGRGKSLVLGNYVLMEKIGAGGMGQVFKAEHRRMHRMVAVKVLPANTMKDPATVARFEREVRAAAKLRHPNIIAADDADQANGVHFLVMELVEGSDLSALVKKRGPLPFDRAVTCILQAARGLEFAHEQGVVHRDIKPANLLIDARGTVKILDMGLARIEGETGGHAELTSTGAVMGTVDYMAPEQALSTKTADARSDIYSLGISLWYLLTGRCAYDGDTLMAKLLAHRDAPIPSLSAGRGEIPSSVDAVFQKMVAKQAKDRYQTMSEVIRDLEACQVGSASISNLITSNVPATLNSTSVLDKPGGESVSVTVARQLRPTATLTAEVEATMISGDLAQATILPKLSAANSAAGIQDSLPSRVVTSPPWFHDRRVQIGGGAAVVLVLLSVIFLLQTPGGTLRVEILDPDVEMKLKGTEVSFHGSSLEPVSLKAGEKKLLVTRGDLSFETESFTIKKGTETRVKVELLGENLVVNDGGKVIAEQPIKRKGIATSTTGKDVAASKPQSSNNTAPPPAVAPFDAEQARNHQEGWAAYLRIPVEYTNSIGMKFRLIPPGEFMMGSTLAEVESFRKLVDPNDQHWQGCIQSETPRHKVNLTQPIYLGINEVTQAEYEKVKGTNPSWFAPMGTGNEAVAGRETADHPVETVSWNDAAEFCAMLSQQENLKPFYSRAGDTVGPLDGTGYRLPSEAEWEFACRAGTATKYWIGDKDEDLERAGWFGGDSGGRTHAAGELKANPFGLADIHGNVWEWVQDGWDPTGYGQFQEKPAIDPNSPFSAGSRRVVRGGSWLYPASFCRSSGRFAEFPAYSGHYFGFRVSLPVGAVKAVITEPVTRPAR